jgi:hypothetical protein
MSIAKTKVIAALCPALPREIVTRLLDEYDHIKQQFFLRKFQPSELNGGRFAECALRMLEYLDGSAYTPFGTPLKTESIISRVASNTTLHESFRLFVPRLARLLLDIRNRRDVAHVGGDVSANLADSILICHCSDWLLTEIVRHFYSCSIEDARRIALAISEVHIPVVAEVDGFIRVQNTALDAKDKTLVVMYYKTPSRVKDAELAKWIRYTNLSRYKSNILSKLDDQALLHYEGGECAMLPKARPTWKQIFLWI